MRIKNLKWTEYIGDFNTWAKFNKERYSKQYEVYANVVRSDEK